MERIKTGITGFDVLVSGGIPVGATILLAGSAGSGKSLFSLQYLLAGAKMNEPGIYLTFEQDEENVLECIGPLAQEIKKQIKADKIRILKYDPYRFQDIVDILASNIKQLGAKRLVIDSLSAIGIYIQDIREIRKTIVDIQNITKEAGCTTLLVAEVPSDNPKKLSRFDVEEFVSDGIIVLYYTQMNNEYTRSIFIWKMRGTNHSRRLHPFKIGDDGLAVYPKEEALVKL